MRRLHLAAATAATALALVLTGCATPEPGPTPAASALLAEHDLDDLSTMELINKLDQMRVIDRPTEFIASVRPDALLITDGVHEESFAMPEEVTYVSVAPFVEQTHDCYFHSLTTCRGELSGQQIDVRILDAASGATLVDESTTTFDNGFAGFWLPRDITGTIEVTYDGKTGSTPFSTATGAASCITTLRLT
ncbi:MAG TPA: CueP family metal-binding protein [Microbacteriaceae bacterium]|nr:CueP family metal-binding protein [Microbacteriaceae bacterium]